MNQIDIYQLKLQEVCELYNKISKTFYYANNIDNLLSNDIISYLSLCNINKIPRNKCIKISILGLRGSGKTTQCIKLCHKLDLVHISISSLIKREQKKQTELWLHEIKSFYQAGILIPDHIIIPLVLERIKQYDCQEKGYVLDGFPRTIGQVIALEQAKLIPNRVIILQLDNQQIAYNRIIDRRYNSMNEIFHLNQLSTELLQKLPANLIHNDFDTDILIKQIHTDYLQHINEIIQHYQKTYRIKHINAEITQHMIHIKIVRFILNSLKIINKV